MPVKSCGFAIGNLRARENNLLKQNDLSQLMTAKSVDELASMLRDKGIGDPSSQKNVPDILKDDTENLWSYLKEIAPDMNIFEPFLYENDFHNLKAILKAVIMNTDYQNLLLLPANINTHVLEVAIKEKKFDLLPDYIKDSAQKAYEVLTQSGDSQLSDGIIDAGCMTAQINKIATLKNKIVKDIIITTVFYSNIKVALRAAKSSKNSAFLDTSLTENGVISKQYLKNAALASEEKVLELLSGVSQMGGLEATECYKRSPGDFEKFCDDRIIKIAKNCKYVTMGVEPLVGYMLARKAQIKDIRIIYSGIKTSQSDDRTLERLRELYG